MFQTNFSGYNKIWGDAVCGAQASFIPPNGLMSVTFQNHRKKSSLITLACCKCNLPVLAVSAVD